MFRNELCPVDFYTVEFPSGHVENFIDMKTSARIRAGASTIEFSPPEKCAVFERAYLTRQRLSDNGISMMLGSGSCDDVYTRSFYGMYKLPNFVRIACILKVAIPDHPLEIRPVTSLERVALCNVLHTLKAENKLDKIHRIKSRLKRFEAKEESNLFPFVFPIYPTRDKDEKVLDYRIFAVGVGWDQIKNKWRDKTVFETISTAKNSNFAITVTYDIDEDGIISSNLILEDRIKESEARQKEILGEI